jgi:hypothetical protein
LQRIREAGIIDEDGKLAPPYNRTMESEAAEEASSIAANR